MPRAGLTWVRCQYDPTTAVGALHPLHVGLGIGQSATGESMSRGYPWTSATHTRRGESMRTAGRGTPSLSRLTQPRSTSRWPASTSSEWPGPSRPVTRTTCCSGLTTSSPRGGVCGAGSVTSCCPPLRGSITDSAPGSTTRAVPTSHVIDPTPPRRCPGLHRRNQRRRMLAILVGAYMDQYCRQPSVEELSRFSRPAPAGQLPSGA